MCLDDFYNWGHLRSWESFVVPLKSPHIHPKVTPNSTTLFPLKLSIKVKKVNRNWLRRSQDIGAINFASLLYGGGSTAGYKTLSIRQHCSPWNSVSGKKVNRHRLKTCRAKWGKLLAKRWNRDFSDGDADVWDMSTVQQVYSVDILWKLCQLT